MSESRFSQFYTNNANASSSEFKETYTVEELKEDQHNAAFQVVPCKNKPGLCYFACGQIRGSVSKDLMNKLQNKQAIGSVVVSHVVHTPTPEYPEEFDGLMLHEQNTSNAIATW